MDTTIKIDPALIPEHIRADIAQTLLSDFLERIKEPGMLELYNERGRAFLARMEARGA